MPVFVTVMGIVRNGVRSAYGVDFVVGWMREEMLNVFVEGGVRDEVKLV